MTEQRKASQVTRYGQRQANGLCVDCGIKSEKFSRCTRCRARRMGYHARLSRMKTALVLVCLSLASSLQAQTITNVDGTKSVTFTASADQTTTAADGTPILTRYELRFTPAVPASCAAQAAINLGKPTPTANVITSAPLTALGTLPANCIYTAVVAAIGPGGEGVSVPTNPFARVVVSAPAAGGKPAFTP